MTKEAKKKITLWPKFQFFWAKNAKIFKNNKLIKKVRKHSLDTVLSLINAPGALQFFKRGMFIRGKFSMQKCSV